MAVRTQAAAALCPGKRVFLSLFSCFSCSFLFKINRRNCTNFSYVKELLGLKSQTSLSQRPILVNRAKPQCFYLLLVTRKSRPGSLRESFTPHLSSPNSKPQSPYGSFYLSENGYTFKASICEQLQRLCVCFSWHHIWHDLSQDLPSLHIGQPFNKSTCALSM